MDYIEVVRLVCEVVLAVVAVLYKNRHPPRSKSNRS